MSMDRFLICILLAACVSMVCSHGKLRRDAVIRGVALAASISLCVMNQQRFQAWHWMFVLGLGTSFLGQAHRMRLLQSVLATVYVCSSLSRLAPTAYHGMSAAILDTLLSMTHIKRDVIPGSISEFLCHAS
ncbi:MAG: hypothetical protein O2856_18495, partial [Planctomycetota bacterium]|nr:hypothetical protein [Planctomycetota bacterium]